MKLLGIFGFFVLLMIVYRRENSLHLFLSHHRYLRRIYPIAICLMIASLIAVQFDLSPFNAKQPMIDSSVFLYIGREMLRGAVPYKDLFDHKGICLFFIEYLGYVIGFGNAVGVWIIELINLFFTVWIFYQIAKLFTNHDILCFFSSYLILQICTDSFFEGGNLVEEYALPWISLSFYYVVRFFVEKTYKLFHIIAIGGSFAVVFFLRVNMVGVWGALLLSVMIYFLKNKQIIEIFKCAFLFVLGCCIVVVPILVYLTTKHAIQDMIDYYFTFNFSYTGSQATIKNMLLFALKCIAKVGIIGFCIVYSLLTNSRNKVLWLNAFALGISFLSAAISGRAYTHYGIILIPFLLIPPCMSLIPIMEKSEAVTSPIHSNRLLVPIVSLCLVYITFNPAFEFYLQRNKLTPPDAVCEYISSQTNENDDVLVLNNCVSYYLISDRRTRNKFFYQEPPIDVSDSLCEEFLEELQTNPSDYIIDPLLSTEGGYQKVINYLNNACDQGLYTLEQHNGFKVYVRKK